MRSKNQERPLNRLSWQGWVHYVRTDPIDITRIQSLQEPKRIDKFGVLRSNDEKARLDNFAIELNAEPGSIGYIIVFGKRGRPAREAKKRADNAKNYLLNYNRTSRELKSLDHCYRSKIEYELWIVLNPANPPSTCIEKKPPVSRTKRE